MLTTTNSLVHCGRIWGVPFASTSRSRPIDGTNEQYRSATAQPHPLPALTRVPWPCGLYPWYTRQPCCPSRRWTAPIGTSLACPSRSRLPTAASSRRLRLRATSENVPGGRRMGGPFSSPDEGAEEPCIPTAEEPCSVPERLTRQDLVDYLASGCKPRDRWRIGTEHEKLGFDLETKRRLSYEQIEAVLKGLVSRFGWLPIEEEGKIVGCSLDGQSVTLEPGGQLELSGAPVRTLHETCAETNSHLYQVKSLAEEVGAAFLGLGFDPKWDLEDVPVMPKGRYRIMKAYMPTVGTLGTDMMFRSCTIQVNLDFADEQDMVEKFRVGLALQPIASAMFANSPFRLGKPAGFRTWRQHVWQDTDPARCGNLPFVFDDDFGFDRYVEHVLDVPMYFVYRAAKGGYVNCCGASFRDFMEGKLEQLPGEFPTINDWESHLTTLFPEVRLKRYMEMRGADAGPWRNICALPALWVGLLYDDQAQTEALEMIEGWTPEERDALWKQVPITALETPFRDGTVRDVARRMLVVSRGGLERRGLDEGSFPKPLDAIVESGVTPADALLASYAGEWGGDLDRVYEEWNM